MWTFSAFFDGFGNLDWLAILLGTAAAMFVGFLWYGPLFGKLWAAKSGMGEQTGAPAKMVLTLGYFAVFNIGLQYLGLVLGDFDFEHALVAGVVLAVMAIGPALFSGTVWAGRHPTVFLIDLSHWFVAGAVAVMVQSLVF